ncbi:hypothetical protein Bca52824_000241 [Brassica carinata]|uniref:RHOMBOID-like protein n=1 Tax=Brassica carinata TaxID=52824 RepID=A0A8X7WG48_BRACI|nr:hypothetical protein Bca52824_000241 [Brassica carinata]
MGEKDSETAPIWGKTQQRESSNIHPVNIESSTQPGQPRSLNRNRGGSYAERGRGVKEFRSWFSWLIPCFVIANVVVFVITMYVNNCPKKSGDCFAGFLGRFSFQSTRENPLLGPSSLTLRTMGGLEVKKVVKGDEGWRLLSCNWLHGGVVHLLVNMLTLLFIGMRMEREFGFIRIGLLYLISGFGGSILSALFLRSNISVGASGAVFGLLGGMLSEIFINWTIYSNKVVTIITLVLIVAVNLGLGVLPGVDNFAHIGGFATGFFLGFVLLIRPHYGWINQRNAPLGKPRKYKIYQAILWTVSLLLLLAWDLIEGLIKLGFYYRELDRFANKSRNLSWIRSVTSVHPLERADELSKQSSSSGEKKPSVYRRAIANGIVEILSVYRSAVLHIEQKLLAETTPILATVTQGLNKVHFSTTLFVLFPPLYEVVLEIERDDIRGGQLLNVLNKRCHCGVPELRACLQRLLWHGHQVMYNQLAAWMVYGILQDPHEGFSLRVLIYRQEDGDLDHRSSQEEISEKLARTSVHETSLTDWHSGFHISLDMLPDHIPIVLVNQFFCGEGHKGFRNPSPAFQFQKDKSFQQTMRGSQRIGGFMHSDFSEKETELDADLTLEELLPQSEADKIEAMLKDLKESSEFHKRSFECTVDSVRAIAASHLWQLVSCGADLNGHLKALKDYFLLEKEISFRLPSFGVTVRSSQADLARSKLALTGKANLTSDTSVDGWDAIALEYSVDWPMQLFFTQVSQSVPVLDTAKRTQMELEKSWASVMHQDHMDFAQHRKDGTKESISQQRRQGIRPMWRVREHMAFLIRNLQFYIQVDVIESQWKVLQTHIEDSQDFTELVGFHQEYLSALISQSFLDIGAVSRILDSIMKLCLQFCWNIENHESNPNTSGLENISEEFNQKSNSLYTILRSSKLAGSQRAPFLRRFLLRLNFNSFYEATTRGLLNVVRQRPALPL